MSIPLRVLVVEDSEDDAGLLLRTLRRGGFELTFHRVDTAETMQCALDQDEWDIVISDYDMPQFSGLAALELLRYSDIDLPFIMVSGQIGEDAAVEVMKAGAHDYIVKDNLSRLVPAVERELFAAQERRKHRQAEEAVRRAEQRYRELFEEAPVMYVITRNQEGVPIIENCNNLFLTSLGYSQLEVIGQPLAEFYSAQSQIELLEQGGYQRALDGTFTTEERELVGRDGHVIKTLLRASPETDAIGQVFGTRAMFVDITERERAEAEIRRRNNELALLNRVIAASAASQEPEAVLETTCRELALLFDVPQAAATLLNQDKAAAVVVAEYRAEGRPSILNEAIPVVDNPAAEYVLKHKTPIVLDEAHTDPRLASFHKLLRRRGTVSMLLTPLVIEDEVVGSLSVGAIETRHFSTEEVDLAARVADQVSGVLARARLAHDHRRLIAAIEQTAESVIITDAEGTIQYVNPAFEHITGYSRAEAVGQTPRIMRSGKLAASFYQELWITLNGGNVWHGRFINKKKDGTLYTDEATITPVRDENGAVVNYVSVQRDVTRELELEEQYRQAQKMEAIGQLTGGIAHDFNNLLTAINGFAELTLSRMSRNDPHRAMVDKIFYSGQRAADLVRQLLAFSRKQVIEPKVLNLNNLVTELDKMLRRIIGEHILIETKLSSDLWPVKVDPAHMEQVILNLAVNARDAMPEGGRLMIETINVLLDHEDVIGHVDVQPGECVLLTVNDTGIGMSKGVQARIFEPFFTTKEVGKGTGLGLATVFGIIKQSGGDIQCYSEEGRGTSFKVYLPRVEDATVSTTQHNQFGTMPTGTETVLLVEDDPLVQELTADTLRMQGYTVLEAANGQKALQLAEEYSDEIHLLLTDVVMPKMSGRVLAERLSVLRPDTKVIFTSGYTDETVIHHGVQESEVTFIPKPFSPAALMRKVREVLDI